MTSKIRRPRYWLRNMQHGKVFTVSGLSAGVSVASAIGWNDYQIHGRNEFASGMGDWVVESTPNGGVTYRGGNGLVGAQEWSDASLALQP